MYQKKFYRFMAAVYSTTNYQSIFLRKSIVYRQIQHNIFTPINQANSKHVLPGASLGKTVLCSFPYLRIHYYSRER